MSPPPAPEDVHWDLESIVAELGAARERWRGQRNRVRDLGNREFPSRDTVREIVNWLRAALFPLRLGPPDLKREGEDFFVGAALDSALNALHEQVQLELACQQRDSRTATTPETLVDQAGGICAAFGRSLARLRGTLDTDVEAAYRGDPAARSVDEVLLCYPGILALIHHRLAHELYLLGVPLIARIIAELAHSETGIDIHPGATIGPHFFIDHGTGVVIGETAEIGEHVRIYQAVTLGAKRIETGADGSVERGAPRHPIVEDNVVIYAGATILGRVTIGRDSIIGGNVWLTRGVPPGSRVTQARSDEENTIPKPVQKGGAG